MRDMEKRVKAAGVVRSGKSSSVALSNKALSSEFVLLEDRKGVRSWVVHVKVPQRQCGQRGCRKYNIRRD